MVVRAICGGAGGGLCLRTGWISPGGGRAGVDSLGTVFGQVVIVRADTSSHLAVTASCPHGCQGSGALRGHGLHAAF